VADLETLSINGLNLEEVSDPSTPASGRLRIYGKTTGLFYITDGGTVVGPLAAASGAVFSGAKAYTTGVSINNAVITFASEVYDTDAYHGATTSRLTVPSDGYYRLAWGGFVSATTARTELRLSGNPIIGGNGGGQSLGNYAHGFGTFQATTGQYFEVFAVTSGANTFGDNADIGDNFTFEIQKVG
jgi:hypothetical protein